MLLVKASRVSRVLIQRSVSRLYSSGEGSTGKDVTPAKPAAVQPAAPAPPPPVPFDNTKYNCDLYYQHKTFSFYDFEASMAAKRVGQPSSKVKK